MDHVFLVPHAHWTSADVFQARLTSTWVEKFFEQAEFVPYNKIHAVHATMRHRTYTSWVRTRDVLVSLCSQDALAGVLATTAAPNLWSNMDKCMVIPALRQPFTLGTLYDARSNQVVF